jgi:hypothetical protein
LIWRKQADSSPKFSLNLEPNLTASLGEVCLRASILIKIKPKFRLVGRVMLKSGFKFRVKIYGRRGQIKAEFASRLAKTNANLAQICGIPSKKQKPSALCSHRQEYIQRLTYFSSLKIEFNLIIFYL